MLEKLGGMSFSLAAYEKLTPDEQLFVSVNLERVKRGRPAIAALTKSLDAVAQDGANADSDPPLGRVPGTLPGRRPLGQPRRQLGRRLRERARCRLRLDVRRPRIGLGPP